MMDKVVHTTVTKRQSMKNGTGMLYLDQNKLDKIGMHAKPMAASAMDEMLDAMTEAMIEVFDSEGFGEWDDLSDVTVRKKDGNDVIFYETGQAFGYVEGRDAMIRSVNFTPGNMHLTYSWPDNDVHDNSNVSTYDIMEAHEFGIGRLPPRPWLTMAADNRKYDIELRGAQDWLMSLNAFHITKAQIIANERSFFGTKV